MCITNNNATQTSTKASTHTHTQTQPTHKHTVTQRAQQHTTQNIHRNSWTAILIFLRAPWIGWGGHFALSHFTALHGSCQGVMFFRVRYMINLAHMVSRGVWTTPPYHSRAVALSENHEGTLDAEQGGIIGERIMCRFQ